MTDNKRIPRHEYGKDAEGNVIPPENVAARLERAARLMSVSEPDNPLWRVMLAGATKIKVLEAKVATLSPKTPS